MSRSERTTAARRSPGVPCQNCVHDLTCCFTLGTRAHPFRLPVCGQGVRLAGAPVPGVTPRRMRRSWSCGTRWRCCGVRLRVRGRAGLTGPCCRPGQGAARAAAPDRGARGTLLAWHRLPATARRWAAGPRPFPIVRQKALPGSFTSAKDPVLIWASGYSAAAIRAVTGSSSTPVTCAVPRESDEVS